jgi:hypothetical protein
MNYEISVLSSGLLVALALGLVVGWASWSAEDRSWSIPGLCLAGVLFLLGALLAAKQVYSGRVAFYLETLMLMSALYAIGLMVGDVARTVFPPHSRHPARDAKVGG